MEGGQQINDFINNIKKIDFNKLDELYNLMKIMNTISPKFAWDTICNFDKLTFLPVYYQVVYRDNYFCGAKIIFKADNGKNHYVDEYGTYLNDLRIMFYNLKIKKYKTLQANNYTPVKNVSNQELVEAITDAAKNFTFYNIFNETLSKFKYDRKVKIFHQLQVVFPFFMFASLKELKSIVFKGENVKFTFKDNIICLEMSKMKTKLLDPDELLNLPRHTERPKINDLLEGSIIQTHVTFDSRSKSRQYKELYDLNYDDVRNAASIINTLTLKLNGSEFTYLAKWINWLCVYFYNFELNDIKMTKMYNLLIKVLQNKNIASDNHKFAHSMSKIYHACMHYDELKDALDDDNAAPDEIPELVTNNQLVISRCFSFYLKKAADYTFNDATRKKELLIDGTGQTQYIKLVYYCEKRRIYGAKTKHRGQFKVDTIHCKEPDENNDWCNA